MAHKLNPKKSDEWSKKTTNNVISQSHALHNNSNDNNNGNNTAKSIIASSATRQIQRHQSDDWSKMAQPIPASKKLVGQSIGQRNNNNNNSDGVIMPVPKKITTTTSQATSNTNDRKNNNDDDDEKEFEDFLLKKSHTMLHKDSQATIPRINSDINPHEIQRKETISDHWNQGDADSRHEIQRKDTVSLELVTADLPARIDVDTAMKNSEKKHSDDVKKRQEEQHKKWLLAEKARKEKEEQLRKEAEERRNKLEKIKKIPSNDARALICTKSILCCYQKFEDLHVVFDHISNEIQFFNLTDNHIDNKFNKVTERGVRFGGMPLIKLCNGKINRNGNESFIFQSIDGVKCNFKFEATNKCDEFIKLLNESMGYAELMGHHINRY